MDDGRQERLTAAAEEMLGTLRALIEWAHQTGGWEAACWKRAEAVVRSLDYDDEIEEEIR